MNNDRHSYADKKAFFDKVITVYGRKPTLEILRDEMLEIYRLHVASSNKPGAEISAIKELAQKRNVQIQTHSREQLARISRNGRQDQGVAIDVLCPSLTSFESWYSAWRKQRKRAVLIAVDGVSNSQNLGMIIRSCCAAGVTGILLPDKGTASLNPLCIKASAGSVFKAPIITCESLPKTLPQLREEQLPIYAMRADSKHNLFNMEVAEGAVLVIGNESLGVSDAVAACCTRSLAIPMQNDVESLNVAVSAALIAYHASGRVWNL